MNMNRSGRPLWLLFLLSVILVLSGLRHSGVDVFASPYDSPIPPEYSWLLPGTLLPDGTFYSPVLPDDVFVSPIPPPVDNSVIILPDEWPTVLTPEPVYTTQEKDAVAAVPMIVLMAEPTCVPNSWVASEDLWMGKYWMMENEVGEICLPYLAECHECS